MGLCQSNENGPDSTIEPTNVPTKESVKETEIDQEGEGTFDSHAIAY